MRISDWSSDVCSSDLASHLWNRPRLPEGGRPRALLARRPARLDRPWSLHVDIRSKQSRRAARGSARERRRGEGRGLMRDPDTSRDRDTSRGPEMPREPGSWSERRAAPRLDRKSVVKGESVYARVDLGGGRRIKKKKHNNTQNK